MSLPGGGLGMNRKVFMQCLKDETLDLVTQSPEDTVGLGRRLGELLQPGGVVALMGDLGAGKTVFCKGIARGLGVEDEGDVTSPTFVLVNEYRGRCPVYHLDLYRLQDASQAEDLGWDDFIFGDGVTLIEWADKIPGLLPAERLEARLHWISAGQRRILLHGIGEEARGWVHRLGELWNKEE